MTPETRAARSLSGNSVQWLLAIGPAQRQRTAVGRWQEATGYFWILVGVVAMLGSFIPPLLAPFVGVPLADTIGWSWRREHGFNYASLYGFDGAFRIGFMYVLVARAEVESFVFNTIFLRSMIVAPFGAILTWLGLLFMGVSAMVVFIDIFTPVTTLLIWEQTRYRERFRHGDPGKSWWKVWLSLPQTDYRRTRISYVLEYEAVLQGLLLPVVHGVPEPGLQCSGILRASLRARHALGHGWTPVHHRRPDPDRAVAIGRALRRPRHLGGTLRHLDALAVADLRRGALSGRAGAVDRVADPALGQHHGPRRDDGRVSEGAGAGQPAAPHGDGRGARE